MALDPKDVSIIARIASSALPILISRAGGTVTITQSEFDEIANRYGGWSNMAVHTEKLSGPGIEPNTYRLTLIRKEPAQGELPV